MRERRTKEKRRKAAEIYRRMKRRERLQHQHEVPYKR